LGGTANQLCAGLGLPIVSVREKGKLVQKKILGDSEILEAPTPEALFQASLNILKDPQLYRAMSAAGRERMGVPGCIGNVIKYTEEVMGWKTRTHVYARFVRSLPMSVRDKPPFK
jgi:tetraacyldisaccharide 4'-kinase